MVAGSLPVGWAIVTGSEFWPTYLGALLTVILITAVPAVPYRFKAGFLVSLLFSLAVVELLQRGVTGGGRSMFIVATVLAGVFFNWRAGAILLVASLGAIGTCGWLVVTGRSNLPEHELALSVQAEDWINIATGLTLTAGLLLISVAYLMNGLARSLETVRSSADRLRSLFEAIPFGICLLDAEDRIMFANSILSNLTSRDVDDLRGCKIEDVVDGSIDGFSSDSSQKGEYPNRIDGLAIPVAGGESVPVTGYISTFSVTGDEKTIAIFIDARESLRIEEKQRSLEQQMHEMQRMESLGLLAGGIAHDFNNLLLGVIGNADLALLDAAESSPSRRHLEEVIQSAQRAADLCRQLLAYSGKGRFVIKHVDLSELVQEMGGLLEVTVDKKVNLHYQLEGNLPAVEADVTQISQVVMNLVLNASEAMSNRRGDIYVRTGVLQCSTEYLAQIYLQPNLAPGNYVFLEVADNGDGMDKETVRRIFDPFFTTKDDGHGLGLAATVGIVRGHGGAIRVYSEPKKGSAFKLLFPASNANTELLTKKEPADSTSHGEGVVLVVDDEMTIRSFVKDGLTRYGYEVLEASNWEDALAVYESRRSDIRAVLLDMTMPRLNGEETFRALREIDPDVRVVLTSGFNEQETVAHFVGKGLAGFLQKPYRMSDLLNAIEKSLEDTLSSVT